MEPLCEWEGPAPVPLRGHVASPWPPFMGAGLGAAAALPCSRVPLLGQIPGE